VRHSKRPRRSRAHRAPADAEFERALLGESSFGEKCFNPREDRKTLQLCRQVQRAVALALPGDCADERLSDLYVESVEPMGGPGQLLVRVTLPPDAGVSPGEVMERLAAYAPRLRAIVAREISRKRVPALTFVVLPADAVARAGEEVDDER